MGPKRYVILVSSRGFMAFVCAVKSAHGGDDRAFKKHKSSHKEATKIHKTNSQLTPKALSTNSNFPLHMHQKTHKAPAHFEVANTPPVIYCSTDIHPKYEPPMRCSASFLSGANVCPPTNGAIKTNMPSKFVFWRLSRGTLHF